MLLLLWIPPCFAQGAQAPIQPLRHQFSCSSFSDEFNWLHMLNLRLWVSGFSSCTIFFFGGGGVGGQILTQFLAQCQNSQ